MTLILGRKRGMTQFFRDDGTLMGVTVVEAGPCVVAQVRTKDKDGYDAVQLGFEDKPDRLVKKPQRGHFKKAGIAPKRFLREERLEAAAKLAVGDVVKVDAFKEGDYVDVVGTTKGRGFAGTIKRHGFNRGPETHGSMNVRAPGSIASRRIGKLPKGKRMGGHYGVERCTSKNLQVVRVDAERNLLFVRGAVAGHNDGLVMVQSAKTPRKRVAKA
ncbi:MAG: 50S ribosomal protein L3 [Planctomycetes bacterium]|nr:50S ribosomal protein L3 [Planctomycetota bacterium]